MAQILRQSTAVDVLIGPFVDTTDGATGETGETPAVKLSKNGQTLAAKNDNTTPEHDADGYYNCELDATDTNTVGTLVLTVAATATALPVRHEYQVIEEAVYDNLYAASAPGPLAANSNGSGLTEAGGTGDHLTAVQLPSNGLANVTAWTVAITGNITGNLSGSVGSVTGAVGSVTGAVGSVTGNVGGNVVGTVGSVASQTDPLPANIKQVNDVNVGGAGTEGDPWSPAA